MTAHSSQYPDASSPSSPSVAPDAPDSSPGLGVLLLDPRAGLVGARLAAAAAAARAGSSPTLPSGDDMDPSACAARLLRGRRRSPGGAHESQSRSRQRACSEDAAAPPCDGPRPRAGEPDLTGGTGPAPAPLRGACSRAPSRRLGAALSQLPIPETRASLGGTREIWYLIGIEIGISRWRLQISFFVQEVPPSFSTRKFTQFLNNTI